MALSLRRALSTTAAWVPRPTVRKAPTDQSRQSTATRLSYRGSAVRSSAILSSGAERRSHGWRQPMIQSVPSLLPKRRLMPSLFVAATFATVVLAGAGAAFSSNGNGAGYDSTKNVLGQELEMCSTDPLTGFMRNGFCETGPQDFGTHTVCAQVTDEFLEYTRRQGNDLITPRPEYRFPGLKAGDGWCLCASRWREAQLAGVAPPVVLGATHEKTLQYVDLPTLQRHAARGPASE